MLNGNVFSYKVAIYINSLAGYATWRHVSPTVRITMHSRAEAAYEELLDYCILNDRTGTCLEAVAKVSRSRASFADIARAHADLIALAERVRYVGE